MKLSGILIFSALVLPYVLAQTQVDVCNSINCKTCNTAKTKCETCQPQRYKSGNACVVCVGCMTNSCSLTGCSSCVPLWTSKKVNGINVCSNSAATAAATGIFMILMLWILLPIIVLVGIIICICCCCKKGQTTTVYTNGQPNGYYAPPTQ